MSDEKALEGQIVQEKKPAFERKIRKGRWLPDEHERFLEALRIHGKDWELIKDHVGTRDAAHTRSHA